MGPVGEPGQRQRVDLVALCQQQILKTAVAPGAVPGARHQHEGFSRAGLRLRRPADERQGRGRSRTTGNHTPT